MWHFSAKLKNLSVALLSQATELWATMSWLSGMPEPLPETSALTNSKFSKLDTEWMNKRMHWAKMNKYAHSPHSMSCGPVRYRQPMSMRSVRWRQRFVFRTGWSAQIWKNKLKWMCIHGYYCSNTPYIRNLNLNILYGNRKYKI